tara:strand:- start:740 stop:1426 length:687 start_codon:yes stop_codon:yes gene_type:complete
MDLFRDTFEQFLGVIAHDYNLDHHELIGRYILKGESGLSPTTKKVYKVASPPRRTKGKGKTVEARDTCDYTEQELQDCNVSCLKGLCKHHDLTQGGTKPALINRLLNPLDGKPKKRGGRKKKADKPEEPKHDHAMDSEPHDDCEACQLQGNILAPVTGNFEWEIETGEEPEEAENPPSPPCSLSPPGATPSIDDQLAHIMADIDDDLEVCSDLSEDEQSYMNELCEEE